MRKPLFLAVMAGLILGACGAPEPLSEDKARRIIMAQSFSREPVYAEVPQKVTYGPRSPKDDFDELSVRTLRNLQRAGLVTVTEKKDPDGTETYHAMVTEQGFRILGTMPSARGPVYRGRICEKMVDGVRNFIRHPNEPTTGRAELVWHYDNPTPLYPLFETKINKPLQKPFVSLVSLYYKDGAYKFDIIVKKSEAE